MCSERACRVRASEKEADDVTRRLFLRADLLIHERLEGRHERRVLRAEATAYRLAIDRLACAHVDVAVRRLRSSVLDRVDAMTARVVFDELAFRDGNDDTRQLENAR